MGLWDRLTGGRRLGGAPHLTAAGPAAAPAAGAAPGWAAGSGERGVGPAPGSGRAWAGLAPLQRSVAATPLLTDSARFASQLTTRRNPEFLAPLGHAVGALGPSGVVSGLIQPAGVPVVRDAPALPPVAQRSVPAAAEESGTARVPARPGWLITAAPVHEPRVLPVAPRPVAARLAAADAGPTSAPAPPATEPSPPRDSGLSGSTDHLPAPTGPAESAQPEPAGAAHGDTDPGWVGSPSTALQAGGGDPAMAGSARPSAPDAPTLGAEQLTRPGRAPDDAAVQRSPSEATGRGRADGAAASGVPGPPPGAAGGGPVLPPSGPRSPAPPGSVEVPGTRGGLGEALTSLPPTALPAAERSVGTDHLLRALQDRAGLPGAPASRPSALPDAPGATPVQRAQVESAAATAPRRDGGRAAPSGVTTTEPGELRLGPPDAGAPAAAGPQPRPGDDSDAFSTAPQPVGDAAGEPWPPAPVLQLPPLPTAQLTGWRGLTLALAGERAVGPAGGADAPAPGARSGPRGAAPPLPPPGGSGQEPVVARLASDLPQLSVVRLAGALNTAGSDLGAPPRARPASPSEGPPAGQLARPGAVPGAAGSPARPGAAPGSARPTTTSGPVLAGVAQLQRHPGPAPAGSRAQPSNAPTSLRTPAATPEPVGAVGEPERRPTQPSAVEPDATEIGPAPAGASWEPPDGSPDVAPVVSTSGGDAQRDDGDRDASPVVSGAPETTSPTLPDVHASLLGFGLPGPAGTGRTVDSGGLSLPSGPASWPAPVAASASPAPTVARTPAAGQRRSTATHTGSTGPWPGPGSGTRGATIPSAPASAVARAAGSGSVGARGLAESPTPSPAVVARWVSSGGRGPTRDAPVPLGVARGAASGWAPGGTPAANGSAWSGSAAGPGGHLPATGAGAVAVALGIGTVDGDGSVSFAPRLRAAAPSPTASVQTATDVQTATEESPAGPLPVQQADSSTATAQAPPAEPAPSEPTPEPSGAAGSAAAAPAPGDLETLAVRLYPRLSRMLRLELTRERDRLSSLSDFRH